MEIRDLISTGKLHEALSMLSATVQKRPEDSNNRNMLWELLCIAGDWERADNQLDILIMQNPETTLRASVYRWLIRAEQSRWSCFNSGALPEFINEPTPTQQIVLKALVERRAGDMAKAKQILEKAAATAPVIKGKCNHKQFNGFRDCDDWCAYFLEVLTSKGQYYWVPWEFIGELNVYPPQYPIDLIWRRAHLSLAGGIDGEVYLPAIYVDTPKESEMARLGYQTDWLIKTDQPVSGIGQRLFILADEEIPMMEIKNLTIERS